jgi:hypothetical protein
MMKKARFSSYQFLWLAIIVVFPLINIFWRPVAPNDYWWYIRIGDEIVETHSVPATESFSYTEAGAPKINHSWLASLLFSAFNSVGGIHISLLAVALLVALTYAMLWFLMLDSGIDVRWASFLLILIEIPSSINWAMRPQIFTYPLFVGSLYILWQWEKHEKNYLWGLPVLMWLWANLHGSFILGFVLAGSVFLLGKGDKKKLFFILLAMVLATLINPRGIGAWEFVLFGMTNPSVREFATEWMPPINKGIQVNLLFAWYLFFMLLVGLSSRKLSWLEWSWVLGFGWMALSVSRYDIWFLFIVAPLSAFLLSGIVQEKAEKSHKEQPAVNTLLGLIIFGTAFLFFPSVRTVWIEDAPSVYSDTTPLEATAWLRAHPEIPDPIWAELAFESYLVYALPERPVWIDPRFEVYSPEHWQDYVDVSNASWHWEDILTKNKINTLLVSKAKQPGLILALKDSTNWQEIYADNLSLIFIRHEE